MPYETDLHQKDGAWHTDAKIAAGVDDVDNTHPLNCTTDGTLEVNLTGSSTPLDVIVDNIVPVSQSGEWDVNIEDSTGNPLTSTNGALNVIEVPATDFDYVTGSLNAAGSIVGFGNCKGIRIFAVGVDSKFAISGGTPIILRSGQIFQIIPQGELLNPVIDWFAGSIDVWMEVEGALPPSIADLGLSLGIAHLG